MKKQVSRIKNEGIKFSFYLCLLLFSKLISIFNYSYSQSYYIPDSIALNSLNKKFKTLDSLVHDLTKDLVTDEDKYRVLYVYLSEKSEYKRGQDKMNLLKRNPYGNCMGISKQYKDLCEIAGLKCDIILGETFNIEESKPEYHACNLIYLSDKKYFVDVTFSMKKKIELISNEFQYYPRVDFFFKANPKYYALIFRPTKRKYREIKVSRSNFFKGIRPYGSFFYVVNEFVSYPKRYKVKGNRIILEFNHEVDFTKFKIYLNQNEILRPINTQISNMVTFDLSSIEKNIEMNISMELAFGGTFILKYLKK